MILDTPPPEPQRPREWLSDWVILALIVGAMLALNIAGLRNTGGGPEISSGSYQSLLLGDLQAKQALTAQGKGDTETARKNATSAIAQYEDALPLPAAYRRIGILREAVLHEPGLQSLTALASRKATEGLSKNQVSKLKTEAGMWHTIYTAGMISKVRARGYVSRIRNLELGPLTGVAESEVYFRAGMVTQAKAALENAEAEAASSVQALFILGYVVAFIGILGMVLLVRFGLLYAPGLTRSGRRENYSGALISSFVLYLISFVVLDFVAGLIIDAAGLANLKSVGTAAALGLQMLAMLTAVSLGLDRLRSLVGSWMEALQETGLRLVSLARVLAWGFGGYAAALPVIAASTLVWNAITQTLFPTVPTPEHPLVPQLSEGSAALAMALVVAVVVAPLVEETAFRGMLYGALRGRMGVWSSAVISGTIFALVHPTLPGQFLPIMTLGVVLALLREKTGSLAPGMICHGLNNLAALVQVVLQF